MRSFYTFLLFCVAIGSLSLQAQDLHFTQFYANPLYLNPAMCGQFEGDFRIAGSYRNQYSSVVGRSPYKTYSFSYEGKFFAFEDDYFAVGVNALADKAGTSDFATTQGNITLNYIKHLSDWPTQYLSFGVQTGLAQRNTNFAYLRFGTQFDGVDYNPSLSTQENFLNDNFVFWDVNTGLMYYMAFSDNSRSNVYGGLVLSHINRPNVRLLDGPSERLYMKITAHVGSNLQLGESFDVNPGLLFHSMGPSMQILPGVNIKYIFDNSNQGYKAFQLGVWGRVNKTGFDMIAPTLRFDMNQFSFGVSYDLNASSLKRASSGRGGIELSIMYTHDSGKKRQQGCPRF